MKSVCAVERTLNDSDLAEVKPFRQQVEALASISATARHKLNISSMKNRRAINLEIHKTSMDENRESSEVQLKETECWQQLGC
jgi:hypothetical protein